MTKLDYAPIRKAMRATELDCDRWADATLDELAHAVIAAAWPQLPLQKALSPMGILAAVNSGLFATAVLVVAIAFENPVAAIAATATFGACFLSYACQAMFPKRTAVNIALVAASNLIGAAALVSLVIG